MVAQKTFQTITNNARLSCTVDDASTLKWPEGARHTHVENT